MYSMAFNILNLLAFMTHALLGCCVHHLHDVFPCGHSHLQHLAKCDHVHDHCSHHHADQELDACCSTNSSESKSSESTNQESTDHAVVSQEDSSSDPCENSEGCNHERCSFLTHSDSKSICKSIGQIAFVAPLAASLYRSSFLSLDDNALRVRRVNSPPLLCALQQSWQI